MFLPRWQNSDGSMEMTGEVYEGVNATLTVSGYMRAFVLGGTAGARLGGERRGILISASRLSLVPYAGIVPPFDVRWSQWDMAFYF